MRPVPRKRPSLGKQSSSDDDSVRGSPHDSPIASPVVSCIVERTSLEADAYSRNEEQPIAPRSRSSERGTATADDQTTPSRPPRRHSRSSRIVFDKDCVKTIAIDVTSDSPPTDQTSSPGAVRRLIETFARKSASSKTLMANRPQSEPRPRGTAQSAYRSLPPRSRSESGLVAGGAKKRDSGGDKDRRSAHAQSYPGQQARIDLDELPDDVYIQLWTSDPDTSRQVGESSAGVRAASAPSGKTSRSLTFVPPPPPTGPPPPAPDRKAGGKARSLTVASCGQRDTPPAVPARASPPPPVPVRNKTRLPAPLLPPPAPPPSRPALPIPISPSTNVVLPILDRDGYVRPVTPARVSDTSYTYVPYPADKEPVVKTPSNGIYEVVGAASATNTLQSHIYSEVPGLDEDEQDGGGATVAKSAPQPAPRHSVAKRDSDNISESYICPNALQQQYVNAAGSHTSTGGSDMYIDMAQRTHKLEDIQSQTMLDQIGSGPDLEDSYIVNGTVEDDAVDESMLFDNTSDGTLDSDTESEEGEKSPVSAILWYLR